MNEKENISLNYDFYHDDSLVEMARLNKGEIGKDSIFPYNKFDVKIWSNDHNPPHFHVISDGWDIAFTIDTGKLLEIKKKGKKQEVYRYICTHIDKWLECKNHISPKDTNRHIAYVSWEIIHEQKSFHNHLTEAISRGILESFNELD